MQFFSTVLALASLALAAPAPQASSLPNGGSPTYRISNFRATASPNSIFNDYSFNITYISAQTFAHPTQIFDVCTGAVATSANNNRLATTGVLACHEPVYGLKWAFVEAKQGDCEGYALKVQDPQGYTGSHFFDGSDVVSVHSSTASGACCALNTGADGASFEITRTPGQIQF